MVAKMGIFRFLWDKLTVILAILGVFHVKIQVKTVLLVNKDKEES